MKNLRIALEQILANPDTDRSICCQPAIARPSPLNKYAPTLNKEFEALLDATISEWPQFSGCRVYFIPSSNGVFDSLEQFHAAKVQRTLWEGKQGELRRDALRFLIGKCNDSKAA